MNSQKIKAPAWYWILAIVLFLWNLMGVFSFFTHTFMSEEALAKLPENERALYDEYPMWVTIVFAVAVLMGFLGSFGLLLRKSWSRLAFTLSLVAIIPQMVHNVFYTSSIEVYGTMQAVTMPIIVVVLGFFSLWFARFALKKGWLR